MTAGDLFVSNNNKHTSNSMCIKRTDICTGALSPRNKRKQARA